MKWVYEANDMLNALNGSAAVADGSIVIWMHTPRWGPAIIRSLPSAMRPRTIRMEDISMAARGEEPEPEGRHMRMEILPRKCATASWCSISRK